MHPIKKIVIDQKNGIKRGIYSICSANEYVIKASLIKSKLDNTNVLIESTCNQVNQFGGYTGMTPKEFCEFVYKLAEEVGLAKGKIILGGDHLGPNVWQDETEEEAMSKSEEMVRQYVLAGYTKIHLDASMPLGDDEKLPLAPEIIAERGARLCKVAEEAYQELKKINPDAIQPVYVIGTEVPTPGGMQDESETLQVTEVSDFKETVKLSKNAFQKYNLQDAWKNVVAVVVQPGVEFGNNIVEKYDPEQSCELVETLQDYENIVFEGHSTDYQTPASLKEMVEDGIAILKVGPALTFAVREALYGLANIENELFKFDNDIKLSRFIEVLDMEMIENPSNWQKHYHGKEKKIQFDRKYSFLDRSRYYYSSDEVERAIKKLITNLKLKEMPLTLISQYLPTQYKHLRSGLINNNPTDFIIDNVIDVLDDYSQATNL